MLLNSQERRMDSWKSEMAVSFFISSSIRISLINLLFTSLFIHRDYSMTLKSRSQISRSRYPETDIQIQISRERYPDSDIQIQISRSRYPDPDIQIQISRSRYPDPDIQIQISRSRYPDPDIQIPISRYPDPDIQIPISRYMLVSKHHSIIASWPTAILASQIMPWHIIFVT